MAALAREAHRAAVRLDDGLGNRQTHPGALDAIALVATAIKFLENQILLGIVDSRTSICHAGDHKIAILLGGNRDRLLARRILVCIFEQVDQSFASASQIDTNAWQFRQATAVRRVDCRARLSFAPKRRR